VSEGKHNDGSETWMTVTVDDTTQTPIRHFQLEQLTPNTQYKLKARAYNGLGWSVDSEEFIFRTAPGCSLLYFML